MIRKTLRLGSETPFRREQVVKIVTCAGNFEAHIMLEHKNRIINGKSMLGLLSLGAIGQEEIQLMTDGEDEEAAMNAMSALLGGASL